MPAPPLTSPDLSSSPEFDQIAELQHFDDPTQGQGEWVREIKVADHASVQRQRAELLSTRTKDQRLAAWMTKAPSLTNGLAALASFITRIDPAQEGSLSAPLNGQDPGFDPAGERGGSTPVHGFAQPVLLLDTPASLTLASDAGIAQYAGEHLGHIAQGDVQLSAAHTAAQVSGQTSSLYTHAGGLQIKAANGPLSLRAHTDALQLLASQDIQILSVNSEITVSAQSKIELIAADSGITLDGGNITFTTPGTWSAKGALKELVGGTSGSAMLSQLPAGGIALPTFTEYGTELDVGAFFANDPQLQGAAVEVWTLGDSPQLLGTSSVDSIGRSTLINSPTAQAVEIVVGDNEWFDIEDLQDAQGDLA